MTSKPQTPTLGVKANLPARKAETRRKRRVPARDEYVSYLLSVRDWDYYYSLRISDPKSNWDPGPYSELATLTITGEVIQPEDRKSTKTKVTFSAKQGIMEESRADRPRSIGSLTAHGDELEAYIFIPEERMAELSAVAQSGRLKVIHFVGSKLRYRSALIYNVSINTHFDEADW